jgi:hypothetical protein
MNILKISNQLKFNLATIHKSLAWYSTIEQNKIEEKIQQIAKNNPRKARKLEQKFDILKDYNCIYRFKAIKHIRVLSRLKVYQTLMTLSLALASYPLYANGIYTLNTLIYYNIASGIGLITLYVISRILINVICAMYINKDETKLLISHLNFWARRSNIEIPIQDLKPFVYSTEDLNNLILRLSLKNMSGNMYFSLRLAEFYDKRVFKKLLYLEK